MTISLAQKRINELSSAIDKLPIRDATEGRETMRDMLIRLRDEVIADPEGYEEAELARLEQKELEQMEGDE